MSDTRIINIPIASLLELDPVPAFDFRITTPEIPIRIPRILYQLRASPNKAHPVRDSSKELMLNTSVAFPIGRKYNDHENKRAAIDIRKHLKIAFSSAPFSSYLTRFMFWYFEIKKLRRT